MATHSHHDHSQHRHAHQPAASLGRAMAWGIALNLAFVVIEFTAGHLADSVALASDAAHNLGDAAGLILAWGAIRMAKRKPTRRFTYGYARSTILASLANAGLLLVASGALGLEALRKIADPVPVDTGIVIWVAAIGILINLGSARLLHGSHKDDLNVRGAYLHLMADAAVSLAVVVAGLVTRFTGWLWVDPATSLLVVAVILVSCWRLLREGLEMSLDAVPTGIEVSRIVDEARSIPGVADLHHVHIWPLSTTGTALTGHLVIDAGTSPGRIVEIKDDLRHRLYHLGITHATLETELPGDPPHGH